mmetsp:Transcript_13955/g.45553  ORF Transcript_13955/g.45553 Transcript_13955/m.45553 type:complete len:240 (+) Transcript_13955:125-844(+)
MILFLMFFVKSCCSICICICGSTRGESVEDGGVSGGLDDGALLAGAAPDGLAAVCEVVFDVELVEVSKAEDDAGEGEELRRCEFLGSFRGPGVREGLAVEDGLEALAKHLAALAEGGSDDEAKLAGVDGEGRSVPGEGHGDEGRGDLWLGVKRRVGDLEEELRLGVELEDHGQDAVVLGPRFRHEALGDLELHRDDGPFDGVAVVREGEENLGRDIKGQVPHDVESAAAKLAELRVVDF